MSHDRRPLLALTGAISLLLLAPVAAIPQKRPAAEPPIRFSQEIKPVLSNICFACHGPDEKTRKANLRLDSREGALRSIVPGKPEQSSLYLRMKMHGPGQMPPEDFPKQLAPGQLVAFERWIKQGAKWEEHWAYAPLRKPAVPAVKTVAWPRGPIDRFLLAQLERAGLPPAPEADHRTLLRRLSFDLTGLPPTDSEVRAFAADRSPGAYEARVDRLLASPHFGERMAVYWLDLIRYADTRGYHGDQNQEVSPFRDYIIDSFNRNKPFDVFTKEQIAGDLLPGATLEQRIASGYNRVLMTTEEGGAQPKEYMAKYAADRVRNVSAVWLGSTMGCAECHDHKYDPFTQKDFYSLASFFADVRQVPVGGLDPELLPTPEEAARKADLEARIAPLRQTLDSQTPDLNVAQEAWEKTAAADAKLPGEIRTILGTPRDKRTAKQQADIAAHFRSVTPLLEQPRRQHAALRAELDGLIARIRKTMMTTAAPPAEMRILPRGNWLDDSGPVVAPAVPTVLGKLDTGGRRASRLDLASWIASKENPLTARVLANRLWRLYFGQGLSKSVEDFGAQGQKPSNPELLDWLATELRDGGWDLKRFVKTLVMSAAYRQTSVPSPVALKKDPNNALVSRQGRYRMEAEFVRDNALAVSRLLDVRVGGVSARPYQPAGYWAYLNFPVRDWEKSLGPDQYRRGVYTYWCRTYLHPSLLAFDASTREECVAARVISNTPQQALVLLNDPTYVEAARVLAERILKEGGADDSGRLRFLFREALQRDPSVREAQRLGGLLAKHRRDYASDPSSANDLLRTGDRPSDASLPTPELAAWTSVARVVFNLHESVTRS